jgi:microcystin-dependent protein
MGTAPGMQSYPRGLKGGQQNIALSTYNLPPHNHSATFTPTSESPIKVTIKASTESADSGTPSTGAYLSKTVATGGAADKDEHIYNSAPQKASLVDLGGVEVSGGGATSGSVTIGNTGFGSQFSIQNPMCNVNFAMAMIGTYPSRS